MFLASLFCTPSIYILLNLGHLNLDQLDLVQLDLTSTGIEKEYKSLVAYRSIYNKYI